MANPVSMHIERCIELYGCPIDTDFSEPIERTSYEQMRADLLLLVGIVIALLPTPEGN